MCRQAGLSGVKQIFIYRLLRPQNNPQIIPKRHPPNLADLVDLRSIMCGKNRCSRTLSAPRAGEVRPRHRIIAHSRSRQCPAVLRECQIKTLDCLLSLTYVRKFK